MRYRHCIFDLYGTLVDIRTDERSPRLWVRMAELYRRNGAVFQPGELRDGYFRLVRELEGAGAPGQDAHEAHPEIQIEQVFQKLYGEKGVEAGDGLVRRTGLAFRAHSTQYLRLYQGAAELLRVLRSRGCGVWLLSNAQGLFTRWELERLGLDGLFDGVYLSSDCGCKKPDPRFFQTLLRQRGIDPGQAVMIGNDGICDVQGAKAVGLAAVYIRSNLSPAGPAPGADYVLDEMDLNRVGAILTGDGGPAQNPEGHEEETMMKQSAGILLPISSLPSRYGIGCFSREAFDFVDWLRDAGQGYWQILPLFPTSFGDSPYQSFSTFAGNPYFISLEELTGEGVLTREECAAADFGTDAGQVDYEKLFHARYPLLRLAYRRSDIAGNPDYQRFLAENGWWLSDYALFMAVKERFNGAPWTQWAEDIRLRWGFALDYYRRELYFEIEFQQYLQFKFFQQWQKLKDYANARGIQIIGDIPIYVAMDSADAWAHPELFQLDADNRPTAVAGCPPDGFSADGQLWGNPLYRWDYHRDTGYAWWTDRLRHCFKLYDVTRIDHFRGFDEYYAIPYGEETAVNGHWEKGPGMDLFRHVEQALGRHEVIAEDLGYVTDTVRQLVRESGFPGMKVLEFAFDSRSSDEASDYLPHNYLENCVAYTGTHDNETLVGWLGSITAEDRRLVREYLCDQKTPQKELHRALIALVLRSAAKLCVIPMQDYMGLNNRSRMNKPSTVGTNWLWRLPKGGLTPELGREIRRFAALYGRAERPLTKPASNDGEEDMANAAITQ